MQLRRVFNERARRSKTDKEGKNTAAVKDSSANGTNDSSVLKKISQTSSFIQDVLYEDSCTGVTIIDLFIALKAINENLESLSQSNEKISDRMNFLDMDTAIVWKEFESLLESMRIFLDKMNADALALNIKKQDSSPEADQDTENKCANCGKCIQQIYAKENKKLSCLNCLLSAFKDISLNQHSLSPEAFLGSFLASMLYWQKDQGREKISIRNSSIIEERTSAGSLSIKESTVQMICDICEILNVAAVRGVDDYLVQPLTRPENTSCSTRSNFKDEPGRSGESKQKFFPLNRYSGKHKAGESSEEESEYKDFTSEGDSDFEEAMSCHLSHQDPRTDFSVTCMGDLSKAVAGKKSASTITNNNNNILFSWMGKLSDEIKSKIKQIKSRRKNQPNIKVFEQPFEKSDTALKKHPGMLQFSITASTSVGVFDVTVVQYKERRHLAKFPVYKNSKNIRLAFNSQSNRDFEYITYKDSKDKIWSDDSLGYSESESMETCSNFDDDEMGEFVEIYLQNKGNENIQKKAPVSCPKSHVMDNLRIMEFKNCETQFFEMHRSYPVYFVQEFVRKTKKIQENQRQDDENLSNSDSEEEILTLNTDEKQEKQIVIKGSSSDLVIYIQVEMENDLGPNPSLLINFEKTPQIKGSDSERPHLHESVIRLGGNTPTGESLFNVWRVRELNQISEGEDMERITFEEPLVTIEKPTEEEQEVCEIEKTKENLKNYRSNSSEVFEEKEESKEVNKKVVLEMKKIKQTAPIWYRQVGKLWKLEVISLIKKPKTPDEVIESINSSAGELIKALRLIREIENDIADAQFDIAISILPRLEFELRKHLHSKMKVLDPKEIKNDISVDNFFSSFDIIDRDDSIGGDSDESSDYRFNNLLGLISNLEDAIKASEHSTDKTEVTEYDSSKIYKLLQSLTDRIREFDSGPNVRNLSQTLEIASQLDNAVREYESIVKRQPADYLVPEERSRKRRKPRLNIAEELSVEQHLKNVREKVFEMVEMEALGMENRVQKDFDKLDILEVENDEAMTFLETLLQKTQRRMSEFQTIKNELKDANVLLIKIYENYETENVKKRGENMESGKEDISSPKRPERVARKILISKKATRQSPERALKSSPERTKDKIYSETLDIKSEKTSDKIPKSRVPRKNLDRTPEKTSKRNLGVIPENTPDAFPDEQFRSLEILPDRSPNRISDKGYKRIPEKILEMTPEKASKVPEGAFNGISKKFPERGSRIVIRRTPERVVERPVKKFSEIPERTSNRSSKTLGRTLESITYKNHKVPGRTLGKISEKSRTQEQTQILDGSWEKSLRIAPESSPERVKIYQFAEVIPDISSKRTLERFSEKIPEESLKTISGKTSFRVSEKNLFRKSEISEKPSERNLETDSQKVSKRSSEIIGEINPNQIPETTWDEKSENIPEKTSDRVSELNSERIDSKSTLKGEVFEEVSDKGVEKPQEKTSGLEKKSEEISVKRTLEKGSETVPEKSVNKIPEGITEATSEIAGENAPVTFSERNLEMIAEKTADRISEIIAEKISEKTLNKVSGSFGTNENKIMKKTKEIVSENTSRKLQEIIPLNVSETNSVRITEKILEKILEGIQEETPKSSKDDGASFTSGKKSLPEDQQNSIEQILINVVSAIDNLRSKSANEKDILPPPPPLPPPSSSSQTTKTVQSMEKNLKPDKLLCTIKELKVIGPESLYLSWTEPEGYLEHSVNGYEIYVDGKLNQKVRNPKRLQAVLYAVDISKKIQVHLYAAIENGSKVLLASMDLNG